jgi:hypothetical protein
MGHACQKCDVLRVLILVIPRVRVSLERAAVPVKKSGGDIPRAGFSVPEARHAFHGGMKHPHVPLVRGTGLIRGKNRYRGLVHLKVVAFHYFMDQCIV